MQNRHLYPCVIVGICAFTLGCIPMSAKRLAHEQAVITRHYATLAKEGKTTTEQDHKMLDYEAKSWEQFDAILNNTKTVSDPPPVEIPNVN